MDGIFVARLTPFPRYFFACYLFQSLFIRYKPYYVKIGCIKRLQFEGLMPK